MKSKLLLIIWTLVAAAGCTTNSKEDEVVKFKEPDAFYDLLNLTHFLYHPLTAEELVAQSTFIGTGRVVDVNEGRAFRNKYSKVGTTHYTLVIKIKIDSVAKGNADEDAVYVEYMHGGAFSTETYRANMPKSAVTVFLIPAKDDTDNDDVEILYQGRGHPAGAPLYLLITPQGWLIEDSEGVRQPLCAGNPPPIFGTAKTLLEVEKALFPEGKENKDGGEDEGIEPVAPAGEFSN